MIRVLFVCTGNTCRSPMSEAILKNMDASEIEVKSAGVFAANGQAASIYAQQVLSENGIEHNHRSKSLTQEEIEWATHIFTMTESHKKLIHETYPKAIEKTFTLKEFVRDEIKDRDVTDPYGGTKMTYQETYVELYRLIEHLTEKLKN